jgi:hypothetical protein
VEKYVLPIALFYCSGYFHRYLVRNVEGTIPTALATQAGHKLLYAPGSNSSAIRNCLVARVVGKSASDIKTTSDTIIQFGGVALLFAQMDACPPAKELGIV